MNVDGTDVRRLTNHPGIDTSPTWSPLGHQIAFTSDRTGSPQIYVVGVDGTGLRRITFESYCDRPTWSPNPYNEIAYASRHRARLRHQDRRSGDQRGPRGHVRSGHERESQLLVQRAASGVQLDARQRQQADLADRSRRPRAQAGHAPRKQRNAELVTMTNERSPMMMGSLWVSGRLLPVAVLSCVLAASCVRNPAPVEPDAPLPPPGVEDLAPVPQASPPPRDEPPPIPPCAVRGGLRIAIARGDQPRRAVGTGVLRLRQHRARRTPRRAPSRATRTCSPRIRPGW